MDVIGQLYLLPCVNVGLVMRMDRKKRIQFVIFLTAGVMYVAGLNMRGGEASLLEKERC
jgi:hypothetical protein